MKRKKKEPEDEVQEPKAKRPQTVGGVHQHAKDKTPLTSVLHKVTRPKVVHGIRNRAGS